MRKLIIIAASLAALAIPTAAMATVAVENGTGFVGKGDVLTALGYANDAALQADVGKITFSQTSDTMSTVFHVKCAPTDGVTVDWAQAHNVDNNIGNFGTTTKTFAATPKGNNGKVTGWNLTGAVTATTTTPDTTDYSKAMTCPVGERFAGFQQGDIITNPVTPGVSLTVSNGDKTVALPNTPVVVPGV
jgi:hypothetical protein